MTYDSIISRVADETGLERGLVDRTYKAYWKAIRQHITSLPLMEDLTDDEFLKLRPNVNLPSLGKLNVTLDRYHGMKKHFSAKYERFKEINDKKESNVED